MIEINGMAHVIINVSHWDECRNFYKKLMSFLGLKLVFDGKEMIYFVGGRTALGINRVDEKKNQDYFDQNQIGLHHLCFRAKSKSDIDKLYNYLTEVHAQVVHAPEQGTWAPGYYSVLFEDPAGTRLEVNYVPGQGVLAKNVGFSPGDDYK